MTIEKNKEQKNTCEAMTNMMLAGIATMMHAAPSVLGFYSANSQISDISNFFVDLQNISLKDLGLRFLVCTISATSAVYACSSFVTVSRFFNSHDVGEHAVKIDPKQYLQRFNFLFINKAIPDFSCQYEKEFKKVYKGRDKEPFKTIFNSFFALTQYQPKSYFIRRNMINYSLMLQYLPEKLSTQASNTDATTKTLMLCDLTSFGSKPVVSKPGVADLEVVEKKKPRCVLQ
jgi:hypothetical protein